MKPGEAGTLLVTGATGRVGAALISRLGGIVPMRAASRGGTDVGPASGVAFDLTDPATFDAALLGATALFLMRPPQITRRDVFARFLDAAAAAGLRRVVTLSVIGADRSRLMPHRSLEDEVAHRPFDATTLRPSDFMQNLETAHLEGVRREAEIAVPDGAGRSAFIDVEDVAAIAATVLTEPGHGGQSYNITGPAALSFDEVAAILTRELGRDIRYRPLSPVAFAAKRIRSGVDPMMALVMTGLYTVQRLGKAERVTDTAARLLRRPATSMESYVHRSRAVFAPT